MSRLSVIMTARDAEATLAQALEAIVTQDYPGWWELILVDNGSTDATGEIAGRIAYRAPRCLLLPRRMPRNQASGHNYGAARAEGDHLIFLDADDVIAPGYLTGMAAALQHADLVGASLDVHALNEPWQIGRREELQSLRIEILMRHLPAVVGAAMGVRRTAFRAVGGFDTTLDTQHDLDLSWRLQTAGYAMAFASGAVVHYRYRDTAMETFRQEVDYGRGEAALYRKHRSAGLHRRPALSVAADYARTLAALVGATRPAGRARLATLAGANLGRLSGSVTQRAVYL